MSSAPSATLPYLGGNLYYRHSGKFDPTRLPIAVLVSMAVALICGALYAYAVMYIPIAGWVTFILTGGTGFIVGITTAQLLVWARVRNSPLALLTTLAIGAVLLWFSWVVYIYALLMRGPNPVPFFECVTSPALIWDIILQINDHGFWSIKNAKPTGIVLWGLWLIELGFLLGIPLWPVRKKLSANPFCETCNKWGVKKPLIALKQLLISKADLKQRLEAKDFSIISTAEEAESGTLLFLLVSLQGCASCDNTQTLCIDEVTLTYNKKGELQKSVASVVKRLILTPDETVAVAMAVSELKTAPAVTTVETATQNAPLPASEDPADAAQQAVNDPPTPPAM